MLAYFDPGEPTSAVNSGITFNADAINALIDELGEDRALEKVKETTRHETAHYLEWLYAKRTRKPKTEEEYSLVKQVFDSEGLELFTLGQPDTETIDYLTRNISDYAAYGFQAQKYGEVIAEGYARSFEENPPEICVKIREAVDKQMADERMEKRKP